MGQPTNFVNKYADQVSSSTALATLFTHTSALKNPDGSAGRGGILDRIVIYNPDTIAHTITLFRVGTGLSAASSNVIESLTLPSLAPPYIFEGPMYSGSGDFYQARLGETASSQGVYYQSHYHEMS